MAAGANAVLKNAASFPTTTGSTTVYTAPAGKAFIVSKLTVCTNTTVLINEIRVNGTPIIQSYTLNPGEQFTETGLVVVPTGTITIQIGTANTASIQVFGEEVDAS